MRYIYIVLRIGVAKLALELDHTEHGKIFFILPQCFEPLKLNPLSSGFKVVKRHRKHSTI